MPKRTPYDSLPIVPTIIADTVVSEPYTEQELSDALRSSERAAKVEAKRQTLTQEQRREFADLCESKCRAAYDAKANWFVKIAKSKTNAGRDQLYVWIRHWLASYLNDPAVFRRSCGV